MTLTRRRTFCLAGTTLAALQPLALRAQTPAARVVASFSILADMAQELAPAGVEVLALVGPDSDAHVYQPSPADGKRLAQADLVIRPDVSQLGTVDFKSRHLAVLEGEKAATREMAALKQKLASFGSQ